MTETSLELSEATRRLLLQRGPRLEYATLAWNVVGSALVFVAAAAARDEVVPAQERANTALVKGSFAWIVERSFV